MKRLLKYAIAFLVVIVVVPITTNAQTIKRSKQKTDKPKIEKPKTEKSKTQGGNNSSKKKSQKIENPSRSQSSSSSNSSVPATRSPEPTVFDVTFSCNVTDADMYIDGNDYGKPNGTRTLKTGFHQVKLIAEGYDDYTDTIYVAAGRTSFNFKMTRKVHAETCPKIETFTVKGVSFDMVWVEGGTFTMGATMEQGRDAENDEKPTHQVTLSSYYISRFEVTQELWQAVMGNNPSRFRNNPKNPVECVSWNDCQVFITKLNRLTGRHFRLPTEAEWEYAARGGNQSQNYKYSGSNTLDNVAWYGNNSRNTTHTVGSKAPNELGLYDMSGNVEEWCKDWYGSFSSGPQDNPSGESSGSYHIGRGGSKDSYITNCRVSYRGNYGTSFTLDNLGLRLAL